jgi:hypothetical protein
MGKAHEICNTKCTLAENWKSLYFGPQLLFHHTPSISDVTLHPKTDSENEHLKHADPEPQQGGPSTTHFSKV